MKKLIFIFTLAMGIGAAAHAQSKNLNEEAMANYDGTRGNFDYALNAREHMNVNYELSPKTPGATAHFMIHTPEAMPFSATVTDKTGKTVYTWKPTTQVYLYNADWNLGSLEAGAYTVNIFMGDKKESIYKFNFNKK